MIRHTCFLRHNIKPGLALSMYILKQISLNERQWLLFFLSSFLTLKIDLTVEIIKIGNFQKKETHHYMYLNSII